MKSKILNNLFGKDLLTAMEDLLNEIVDLDYDINTICKSFNNLNESVRIGIYLMALEKGMDVISYRIKKANEIINEKRKEDFIKAYKNGETDRFLAMLGKGDKISLMSDLGVDVEVRDRINFTKEQRAYYEIISNSIMLDQELDKRDGIDKFIKYKKDEKKEA